MKRNRCGGVGVESGGESLISSAGAALLLKSAQVSGLAKELSRALSPWRPARSVHDPGKTVLDLAVTIALGGDCLADAAVVRAQPELFGAVASDPTISRLIDTLGEDSAAVITAIRGARAAARATVWGHRSPVPRADPVIIDLDATLITAHSEKEGATPNFKHGFGFHPLLAFVDHGDGGTGEPLVGMLRPGRANANTAADQIAVLDAALAQLPEPLRVSGAGARRLRVGRAAVAVARPRPGVGLLGGFLGPPTRAGRVGGVAQASLAGRAAIPTAGPATAPKSPS